MGSLTEFFDFINRERMPTEEQQKFLYHYIDINDGIRQARRIHRREFTEVDNEIMNDAAHEQFEINLIEVE